MKRKCKIRPDRHMELQNRIWAYEWIESGLGRIQLALDWLCYPRNLRLAWMYAKNAAYSFHQAARRFWWARKFKK